MKTLQIESTTKNNAQKEFHKTQILKHMNMKNLLSLLLFFCILNVNAQNPTYQEKLYYTCKIWGFVKYYHSEVSNCLVDWDDALKKRLPYIKAAVTNDDFNDELITLLKAAGPMNISLDVLPDTIPPELKRNLDFSWFNNPVIRNDVKETLDAIKYSFRPHPNCWVRHDIYGQGGWLNFVHDDPRVNLNTFTSFPNESTRLLIAFKYWNILHYFNPYNYILDVPSDSMLYNNILAVANATGPYTFYLGIKKMAKDLDDAHAEGRTRSKYVMPPYYYYSPKIILTYAQNKYIVAKTSWNNIERGDVIVSVNGIPVKNLEDNLRPYISAGNNSVFHRTMCQFILNGDQGTSINIVYSDSLGNNHTLNATRTDFIYTDWFYSYYPNDSLAQVKWKKLGCNIGYVNMGQLQKEDVDAMYSNLRTCSAIIFDIRNYPNGTAWPIADKMYPNRAMHIKFMVPDATYPGTFYWYHAYLGIDGNPAPYEGKVIILMNEQTQSQAESSCMILENMKNSVKIGSQTAGANGDVSYFNLSEDIQAGFSSVGVFYPNGDSTQRIGIRPDILVYPTPEGIRNHRDEVLEKALQVAGCVTSVHDLKQPVSTTKVYPNPTTGLFYIKTNFTNNQTVDIIDINGTHVFSKNINGNAEIDASNLSSGAYTLIIRSAAGIVRKKLIILH